MSTLGSSSSVPRHPIGVVARRTGLKPDLIRAWERRYGAVAPGRTETRRRFYSDADVERLLLLRRVVSSGRGISQVAGLSNPELEALIEAEPAPAAYAPSAPEETDEAAEAFLNRCVAAAQRLDVGEMEIELDRASVLFSRTHLIERVLVPLMRRIGDL